MVLNQKKQEIVYTLVEWVSVATSVVPGVVVYSLFATMEK